MKRKLGQRKMDRVGVVGVGGFMIGCCCCGKESGGVLLVDDLRILRATGGRRILEF